MYSRTAIVLHWLAALLILAAFAVGIVITNLPLSPTRLRFINWHKWVGICVLALSVLRLLWRVGHPPPSPVPGPPWQRHMADAAHAGLYFLCLALPLLGWTYSSAAGFPVMVFGIIPLPDLVSPDHGLAALLKAAHRFTGYGLGILVVLHVGAALKHQIVDGNGLLQRLSPRHLWRKAS